MKGLARYVCRLSQLHLSQLSLTAKLKSPIFFLMSFSVSSNFRIIGGIFLTFLSQEGDMFVVVYKKGNRG